MDPTNPVNAKFETIGMDSVYFLNNLGTFAIYFSLKIILVLLHALLTPFANRNKWCRKRRKHLGKRIYWNSWIVVVFETFLTTILCILITFKYSFKISSPGLALHSTACLLAAVLYLSVPIFVLTKVLKNFSHLKDSQFQSRFGALYETKAIKRGKKTLLQPTSFLLRRVFLVFLIVFGT